MKQKYKILIVDNKKDLCELLQFNLRGEGYITEIAYSGEEVLKKKIKSFDLILLEVMMKGMSGFTLAEKIRKELFLNIPIIFITGQKTENDLLTGFNVGGDDYITKPFSVKEVLARIKALLKRVSVQNTKNYSIIIIDEMVLNFEKKSLKIKNKNIKLTKKQFEILALFFRNKERVFSREKIIDKIWDNGTIVTNRTIDVHLTRIRKKLGKYGQYIKSKPGYGYFFEPD